MYGSALFPALTLPGGGGCWHVDRNRDGQLVTAHYMTSKQWRHSMAWLLGHQNRKPFLPSDNEARTELEGRAKYHRPKCESSNPPNATTSFFWSTLHLNTRRLSCHQTQECFNNDVSGTPQPALPTFQPRTVFKNTLVSFPTQKQEWMPQ